MKNLDQFNVSAVISGDTPLPRTLAHIQKEINETNRNLINARIISGMDKPKSGNTEVIDKYKKLVTLYEERIRSLNQLYAEYLQKRSFVFKRVV